MKETSPGLWEYLNVDFQGGSIRTLQFGAEGTVWGIRSFIQYKARSRESKSIDKSSLGDFVVELTSDSGTHVEREEPFGQIPDTLMRKIMEIYPSMEYSDLVDFVTVGKGGSWVMGAMQGLCFWDRIEGKLLRKVLKLYNRGGGLKDLGHDCLPDDANACVPHVASQPTLEIRTWSLLRRRTFPTSSKLKMERSIIAFSRSGMPPFEDTCNLAAQRPGNRECPGLSIRREPVLRDGSQNHYRCNGETVGEKSLVQPETAGAEVTWSHRELHMTVNGVARETRTTVKGAEREIRTTVKGAVREIRTTVNPVVREIRIANVDIIRPVSAKESRIEMVGMLVRRWLRR
ncbi:hypothetical protein FS837_004122 [Tulasnella sp. UAMH 9824]|nr:hypothetical protein FS837_004122 [Tulasnella sp. UAMH 9824]